MKRIGQMGLLTEADYSQVVSAENLERELNQVCTAAAGSLAGVFGPGSLTWQLDRESATFLGAGRALLLQLAHPWVAAAVEQHSDAFADPVGRFHRTFGTVFAMVFGTLGQSLRVARQLHRRHESITGRMPWTAGPFSVGSIYCANAIPALRWIYATLIDTALLAYELVLPALTARQRECFYNESHLFAGLFGIPQACLPRDCAAFSAYFSGMLESQTLSVSERTRAMARRLIAGADFWLPVPTSYQNLTIALLPPRLREQFGFSLGAAQNEEIRSAIALSRRLYPLLPARLRTVGPYQEAEQRLAGKLGPDFVTRICNRFWIGHAELSQG